MPRALTPLQLTLFALPAAPLLALTLPTIIFLPHHFATHVGLSLGVVSAIFLGARALDIVLDPLLGSWQDRTENSFGRRKIWLAAACAPLMALIYFVFVHFGPGDGAPIITLGMLALYALFAAMMVAHLGWSGELDPTYHGRTKTLGAVQTAGMAGQTAMLAIAALIVQGQGGTNADAVRAMGWSLIIALPICIGAALAFVPEAKAPPQPHLSLGDQIKTVLANRIARRVLLPDLLLGIVQGVSGGLFLFFFEAVLGFESQSQTLLAIYFVAGLIGAPIWWIIGRKIGKHRALQAAFIYTAATTAILLFMPTGNFSVVAPFMFLGGMAQGGGILLTRALMADVVDDDEATTGARRSGLYFGLLLTTSKLGLALGPLSLALIGLFGFDPRLGAGNSAEALGALSALFIGAPIVLCGLGVLSLRNYPLDEARQAALAATISARQLANSENTAGPSTR